MVFVGTFPSLVLVGDFNAILDAQLDCVGLTNRKGDCKNLANLLRYFQLSDRYRLDYPNMLMGKKHPVRIEYFSSL